MSKRTIVRICHWCRKVIEDGAPAAHTSVVDIASLNGRTVPVASESRSFHIKDQDCYKESLYHLRRATDGNGATPAVAAAPNLPDATESDEAPDVGDEVYEWGEAFGITAEEVLSGARERVPKVRSPYALRLQRQDRALAKR